jgi:hypothetical protein
MTILWKNQRNGERRPLCGSRGTSGPSPPPDFLSGLAASVNLMRLSLKKAAYVAVYESCVVANPEFVRDDKWRVVTFKGRLIGWTEGNSRALHSLNKPHSVRSHAYEICHLS